MSHLLFVFGHKRKEECVFGYNFVVYLEDSEAQMVLTVGGLPFVMKGDHVSNPVLCVSTPFYRADRTDINHCPVILLEENRGPEQICEKLEGLSF